MSGPGLDRHPQVIETARLVLRRPRAEDAGAIAAGLGDHAVARMLARVPQPYDVTEARAWLARIAQAGEEASHFAIACGDGPLLGVVGIARRTGGLHLGYWLARAHWGRGLMSEAVEAVLEHRFGVRPDERIHAGVFVDNPASLRIQGKLGFAVIGRSDVFSRARGEMVAHLDTVVTAASFAARERKAA